MAGRLRLVSEVLLMKRERKILRTVLTCGIRSRSNRPLRRQDVWMTVYSLLQPL